MSGCFPLLVAWLAVAGNPVWANQVIVAFGDSTTAPRAGVPSVYAKLLQDELPDLLREPVAVYNEGVGGNRTDQALARLNADVRSHKPNIAIVQFGINDSWIDRGATRSRVAIDAAAQMKHPFRARGNYADNLRGIVRILKRDGVSVILMTPNPVNPVRYGGKGGQNELLGTYAQVVRDVATAERVQLVDVWQLYADYASQPGHKVSDLLLDAQHPNQVGHRLVADALEALLDPKRSEPRRRGSPKKSPRHSLLNPKPGTPIIAVCGWSIPSAPGRRPRPFEVTPAFLPPAEFPNATRLR